MRKALLIAGLVTLLLGSVLVSAQQSQLPSRQPVAPFGAQTPNNQDPFNQQSQTPNNVDSIGGGCSNSFDFSQACNSQYLGAI
jgi:hypothetical protein